MNKKLKAKIIEYYGTEINFSKAINLHESVVSKIIQGHRKLRISEQIRWSQILKSNPKELFSD